MVQPYRIPTVVTFLLLLSLQSSLEAKKLKKVICPIGFQVAYTKTKGEPICYRLKGPEKLTEKYIGCTGNLYSSKLYNSLNLTKSELVLWTEYKSLYPGGPFIDYSYTESMGSLLETSFQVEKPQPGIDEQLCVVIDPVSNFTSAGCDEEYYRYCFVEPYEDEESMSREGCEDLRGSWRFWSPKATCLSPATAVGGGTVRATWFQSQEICEKRGGTILYNGWRYSNNPLLHISGSLPVYPLGITYDPQRHSHIVNDEATTPPSEWGLDDHPGLVNGNETSYGAIQNGLWNLVNSSYIFFDIICEKNVELKKVDLVVSADEQNKLILTVSADVNANNIYCFTDSVTFAPTPVKISFDDIHNKILSYILKPIDDGYYWCVHIDSKRFIVSQSNKALWVREEQSLQNHYAVKLYSHKEYKFDNLKEIRKDWERKLRDYIFYSTNYYDLNGGFDQVQDKTAFEYTLREFKSSNPSLSPKNLNVLYDMKIKKVFLDGRTVLLHIQLNPTMKPVKPGTWGELEILYMNPVYFCKAAGHEFVDSITVQCQVHSCVGDFNDGVQVVTTIAKACEATTPSLFRQEVTVLMPTSQPIPLNPENPMVDLFADGTSDSSEETLVTTEPVMTGHPYTTTSSTPPPPVPPVPTIPPINETTTTPINVTINATETTSSLPYSTTNVTTTPLPPTTVPEPPVIVTPAPEEQLQQVIKDLENLINNDTASVVVGEIKQAFDQVDVLLAENLSLEIPGELLLLLDGIGSRLDLEGSENVTTVRENIALLVTDAIPGLPVKGLRIAARENDTFQESAFEILREDFNADNLQAERSDAVVKLPDSVSNSTRRISFVVFRNGRAFQNNHSSQFLVNSRVLSVNVENVTQFDHGESVDIHFNSGTPERNQSRACAYWHFTEGQQGYWSQEGCTFIRATSPGLLDTCRCTHLTHFAEILVPKTVFSEKVESVLELLTIIGCCVSIFGLAMIGVTAILFRSWRRDFSNKIWLQLCIAILLLVTCFLVTIFANFDNYIPCLLVGVALHYSVLASFCWMLVAAVLSYRRLVLVFTRDASHKLLRASAFSWGAPCAVVGILLSVAPHSYAGRFEEITPTGAFCYPSGLGLWLAVYAPIAVMLLANWTLFVLIVRSVFASRRIQRHGDSNEALRCASVSCLLVFLFGLPWVFGLFAQNVVFSFLFTLTATYQGFVLFIFFVVGNKKTRDLWLNKLKIKQTRKIPVTSSTYTNRSTGPGWRAGNGSTVEAKVSKPKSLASPDDSRFS